MTSAKTKRRSCAIRGCAQPSHARGWCRMHYMRWWVHGDPARVCFNQSPAGVPRAFLEKAITAETSKCIFWPFAKNNEGYGQINIGHGRKALVHRLTCDAAHGSPPSEQHVAAHACGNGHLGCINPRHLRWATPAENSRDMVDQGRSRQGADNPNAKLTETAVLEIFSRVHAGEVQSRLAAEFGVTQTMVSAIKRGRLWGWLTGVSVDDLRRNEAA